MSTEANKAAYRRYVEIRNENTPDALHEVVDRDVIVHSFDGDKTKGIEYIKRSIASVSESYEDSIGIIHDLFAEGDKVVALKEARFTQKESTLDSSDPPAVKHSSWKYCHVTRWKDGKMVESWTYSGPAS